MDESAVLADGGEMGALMRSIDWGRTAVGPVARWPQSLRTAVKTLLACKLPMYLAWGPQHIQFYNDAYRPILGNKHPAAMGARAPDTWPEIWPTTGPMWEQIWRGQSIGYDDFVLRIDRFGYPEDCYFNFSYSPVPDDAGAVGGILVTFVETTEKVLTARRLGFLLSLDEAVRSLTDPAQITAVYARLLGEYLGVDRCAYADVEADQDTFNLVGDFNRPGIPSIVGQYRFGDFGREVLERMRADEPYVVNDVERHQPPIGNLDAYRATRIQAVICVPLHKTGRLVAAMAVHSATARAWKPEEVSLVQTVASRCWESIERARVERALRDSEASFRDAFEQSPIGVTINDLQGRYVHVNDAYCRLVGYSREELLDPDRDFRSLAHPEDRPRMLALQRQLLAGEIPSFFLEKRYRRSDGSLVWVRVTGTVRRDAEGRQQFVRLVENIDERKRAEAERERLLESERAAREEVERASRMKDEFLATLSHELRTPLNAILGWSQIIRSNRSLPPDLIDAIDVIERNARAQTQIIEDLLDMSRIISGKLRLDVQRIELMTAVRAAVETVRPAAEAKGVRLQIVLDPLAGPVHGDAGRLQQVFWNLLTNAVKFTPKGGRIQVVLERVNSHLEVSVVDTGEGINPEFLPHVFDRFRQADAGTTRRHGGLGLGLSIVKQLVELHGGSVSVKSGGKGTGATFTVALPLAVIHPESDPPGERRHPALMPEQSPLESNNQLQGINVLVVDDEGDARALVKRLLEGEGARVTAAASAAEAFDALQRLRPDVLVSDIGMPDEDGYSLLRKVRALPPEQGGQTPALALTAYARPTDRMAALRAGFHQYTAKPVEPAELITLVSVLAERSS